MSNIAITGGTGFLGRAILRRLAKAGNHLRCWYRAGSDRTGLEPLAGAIDWVPGQLGDGTASRDLVKGCDVLVHAALDYSGGRMQSPEFDSQFSVRNIAGTLELFEAARAGGVQRVIYISSCAVYGEILSDRPLDETHPMWPTSEYGAHKAAVEAFVSSFGRGEKYPICALRPCGIYGIEHPIERSKWFDLVASVVRGETVTCQRGGKEVHARDVAQAVEVLLTAEGIAGQAYNCCDRYISELDVATLTQQISLSDAKIIGQPMAPKNQIDTQKLRDLGVRFGGEGQLSETIGQLVAAVRAGHMQKR